ncbi:hypothetical protein P4O66_022888 [Electrophorus voltai]|uniref:Uncharacterized protein n=1 Tax=Electrophorus voltai TaxID=2609070 RepID=A0AAD8ZKQ5_9TELE|nr:hypothetical protein P4O66_022888 [Electrophorus voltai]
MEELMRGQELRSPPLRGTVSTARAGAARGAERGAVGRLIRRTPLRQRFNLGRAQVRTAEIKTQVGQQTADSRQGWGKSCIHSNKSHVHMKQMVENMVENMVGSMVEKIVENMVENMVGSMVEKIVENMVENMVGSMVEKIVENMVENMVGSMVEKIVENMVENMVGSMVEKIVENMVENMVGSMVEKIVENMVGSMVEKIVENMVENMVGSMVGSCTAPPLMLPPRSRLDSPPTRGACDHRSLFLATNEKQTAISFNSASRPRLPLKAIDWLNGATTSQSTGSRPAHVVHSATFTLATRNVSWLWVDGGGPVGRRVQLSGQVSADDNAAAAWCQRGALRWALPSGTC